MLDYLGSRSIHLPLLCRPICLAFDPLRLWSPRALLDRSSDLCLAAAATHRGAAAAVATRMQATVSPDETPSAGGATAAMAAAGRGAGVGAA